jgi:hypothetical protein
MRRSPRHLQGNNESREVSNGTRLPNPLLVQTPRTPRHLKSGAALDRLILALEKEYRLGLTVRGDGWSPRKTTETKADKVYGRIKRLYFSPTPTLEPALDRFHEIASGFAHDKQLDLLHGILKSVAQSPISRMGTPLNEPPESSRSVPTCKWPSFLRITHSAGCEPRMLH